MPHSWLLWFLSISSSAAEIRVALVSEWTGVYSGNSVKFIEGFKFVANKINSLGGVPVGGSNQLEQITVLDYDTESDASKAQECVQNANAGVDMSGNNVGAAHIIIAATATMNGPVKEAAQAAGIPNVHTSGGNPTAWLAQQSYAFGIHLPFIWYTRELMTAAKLAGLETITIVRSNAHGFSIASCIVAVQWARDAGLSVVGPSVQWCREYMGTSTNCRIVGDGTPDARCVCGTQAEVDGFHASGVRYNIEEVSGFYAIDEATMGNGLDFNVADVDTMEYNRGIFKDLKDQGKKPDVMLNFALERHNMLWAMLEEDYNPKMMFGWQGGTVAGWGAGVDVDGNAVTDAKHGAWAVGFGQWHKSMSCNDPVFGNNANTVAEFEAAEGRELDYDTAGAVGAGSVLYQALRKYAADDWATKTIQEQRDAIYFAIGSMNDETMWGKVSFNRGGQNIGRGTAAWQIVPDENKELKQVCVLPTEAAEAPLVLPFPTWQSRFGCAAGSFNSGSACELCPLGTAQPEAQAEGMEVSSCDVCGAGQGTLELGATVCINCPAGRVQDGISDNGVCRECAIGRAQSSAGETECQVCSPGTFAKDRAQIECTNCPAGRHSYAPGQQACQPCQDGLVCDGNGRESDGGLADGSQCACSNGSPATSCTFRTDEKCASCDDGYKLNTNYQCEEASCDIPGSNGQPSLKCKCLLSGDISWNGSTPSGKCIDGFDAATEADTAASAGMTLAILLFTVNLAGLFSSNM